MDVVSVSDEEVRLIIAEAESSGAMNRAESQMIAGVMLGAKIGARLLRVAPSATVRRVVIFLLLLAGARALLTGLAIWS